jgi:hypothetical protein
MVGRGSPHTFWATAEALSEQGKAHEGARGQARGQATLSLSGSQHCDVVDSRTRIFSKSSESSLEYLHNYARMGRSYGGSEVVVEHIHGYTT